jgi:hypothetical protein
MKIIIRTVYSFVRRRRVDFQTARLPSRSIYIYIYDDSSYNITLYIGTDYRTVTILFRFEVSAEFAGGIRLGRRVFLLQGRGKHFTIIHVRE